MSNWNSSDSLLHPSSFLDLGKPLVGREGQHVGPPDDEGEGGVFRQVAQHVVEVLAVRECLRRGNSQYLPAGCSSTVGGVLQV